ncbi:MAG: SURF1 family protein [Pseudomonadales bacterium]
MPTILKRFRPDWKTSVLVACLLPLLLSLGYWQLDREQEKLAILADYNKRIAAPPTELLNAWQNLQSETSSYRRVLLQGRFLPESSVLIDNKIRQGTVGYQLVQLFKLEEPSSRDSIDPADTETKAKAAWINRGWVAAGRLRTDLPNFVTPENLVRLHANIYQPLGDPFVLQQEVLSLGQDHPIIAQQFDATHFAQLNRGFDVFPHLLRLEENSPTALAIDWPPVNTKPEKHRGYAIQWFAMALALFVFYLIRSLDKGSEPD